jgi:hypothetical protein
MLQPNPVSLETGSSIKKWMSNYLIFSKSVDSMNIP